MPTPTLKTVRVLGKDYKVRWGQGLEPGNMGEHEQSCLEVRVKLGLAGHEERETLLHELVHAVENQLGIDLPERKVRALSVGLYAVLNDNPKLLAYLFKRAKK